MPEPAKRYRIRTQPGVRKISKQKSAEGMRPNSAQRGYGYKWQRAAWHYLQEHPMCVTCEEAGIDTLATVVDHIEPHRGDDTLFWDVDNWQALCATCHNRKTGKGQ